MKIPMAKPVCSIIVPVYNKGTLLAPCIESLCQMEMPEYEIILVDDGSNDGAGDVCDAFARQHRKIRVIHQENAGVVAARYRGWRVAGGGLIIFVDSDDRVEPDAYAGIIRMMMEDTSIDIGIPHMVYEYLDGHREEHFPDRRGRRMTPLECAQEMVLRGQAFIWNVGKVFRRSLMEKWLPDTSISIGEDLDMLWQLLGHARNVLYDPEGAYRYFIHPGGTVYQDMLSYRVAPAYRKVLENFWAQDGAIEQKLAIDGLMDAFRRVREMFFRDERKYSSEIEKTLQDIRFFAEHVDFQGNMPDIIQCMSHGYASASACFMRVFQSMGEQAEKARNYPYRYIYGTGKVSHFLGRVFEKKKISFVAYVVSDDRFRGGTFQGKPILPLSKVEAPSGDTAFSLALLPHFQKEVLSSLRVKGYQNVMIPETYPAFWRNGY